MDTLFQNIYNDKTVLVTGNTGFKGSWLAYWLLKMGAKVIGYSNDIPTEPSHFKHLALHMPTVFADILDTKQLDKCLEEHQPDIVFHLAAQSLVTDSYKNPSYTYNTNVIGTLNVFEASRKCPSVKAIVNITTDKVYENLEKDIAYNESDRLGGYDIYSSSKACAEILSSSYRNSFLNLNEYNKTHQILLATARAGNVIGGGDWAADRLVPDLIRASVLKQKVQIRSLNAVRPWQHVLEPLFGYLILGQKLLNGEVEFADAWNFGPQYEQCVSVNELLMKFKSKWEVIDWDIDVKQNHFHEAGLLKLDSSKAIQKLNWKPAFDIDRTAEITLNWYRKFYENNTINTEHDLNEFIQIVETQNK
jgi:CDP-glucose 4,6-dehydratase